ncbi:hypothetical protein SDC9_50509 [bioreactor metagenome]|uniref:Uncharacterized protein n=1 Tax=bioreactor metagenome TaxID=1076179 RepID=A0A644WPN3_9ZZZZ
MPRLLVDLFRRQRPGSEPLGDGRLGHGLRHSRSDFVGEQVGDDAPAGKASPVHRPRNGPGGRHENVLVQPLCPHIQETPGNPRVGVEVRHGVGCSREPFGEDGSPCLGGFRGGYLRLGHGEGEDDASLVHGAHMRGADFAP